jgi:hypothetical protein
MPPAAKAWAKGFMEEMLKDRAQLNLEMQAIHGHLRAREFEMKGKEVEFKQTLRMRDETIRSKEFTLNKTKETLTNTLSTLESIRNVATLASADKGELARKVVIGERLLKTAQESNDKLQRRTDELQKKWQDEFNTRSELQTEVSTQKRSVDDLQKKLAAVITQKNGSQEARDALAQRDQALRIIEELKRQMKELQGKLATATAAPGAGKSGSQGAGGTMMDSRNPGAGASEAELRHKLDQSGKLLKAMKDELDRSKRKVDDLRAEETKLRVENGRLQAQLKQASKGR